MPIPIAATAMSPKTGAAITNIGSAIPRAVAPIKTPAPNTEKA